MPIDSILQLVQASAYKKLVPPYNSPPQPVDDTEFTDRGIAGGKLLDIAPPMDGSDRDFVGYCSTDGLFVRTGY